MLCAKLLQLCQLFATPWTVACQAPLSKGFSRQEYWNGLPSPKESTFNLDFKRNYHIFNINLFKKMFYILQIIQQYLFRLNNNLKSDKLYFSVVPGGAVIKNPPANAGNPGSIVRLGRSFAKGNGSPLQYSWQENSMDERGLAGYSPWVCKKFGHDLATKQQQASTNSGIFFFLYFICV